MGPAEDCRLGVLALGDSITNGGGELQWGVAMKSWAEWVARGLGVPFTGCAVDGARVEDVVGSQITLWEARAAAAAGARRYDVGCLYIGINDVRGFDWDAAAFAVAFRTALGWLAARCDRVVCVTAPLDLGRPRAGARKVGELNDAVRAAAREAGALVVDLGALRARNLVMSDHVHLTAFGQLWLAERALEALARDGARVVAWPREMVRWETTWWGRLRGDATYTYRHAKVSARVLRTLAALRLTP